jgi:cytidyltransferase-like protein
LKVGFTCSAFDLLHAGHVQMLREAKDHCDYLICGLQVDPSVDRAEKNQPIQTIVERYSQLKAVRYVDEIIPYSSEADLNDILANFIRVNFTSCTRGEFVDNNEIIPYTRINTVGDQLPKEIRTVVDMYTMQVFNLELEIYKNKCLIESVLQRLVDSGIPFSFDQGGFEHPTFGATQTYFTKYNAYRSKYNLWDYGDSKIHRPYFHITKQLVHNEIAEYYREKTR